MRNKNGFTIVEVVVLVSVLVIIGALGYVAYNNLVAKHDTDTSKGSVASSPTPTPAVIKSSSDLEKISKELDKLSLEDSSSSSRFETASNSF